MLTFAATCEKKGSEPDLVILRLKKQRYFADTKLKVAPFLQSSMSHLPLPNCPPGLGVLVDTRMRLRKCNLKCEKDTFCNILSLFIL